MSVANTELLDELFDFLSTRRPAECTDELVANTIDMFARYYSATWCDDGIAKNALVLVPTLEVPRWTSNKGLYKKYRHHALTFTRTVRAALIGRATSWFPSPGAKSLSATRFGGAISAIPAVVARDFCVAGQGHTPAGHRSTIYCFYVDMAKLDAVQSADAHDLWMQLFDKAGTVAHKKRAAVDLPEPGPKRR